MTYQAYAHVWTADYRYWNLIGQAQSTREAAQAEITAAVDYFWPGDKNPSRRASFLSHCRVIGPGESLPRP
jgi:hypothetical protein